MSAVIQRHQLQEKQSSSLDGDDVRSHISVFMEMDTIRLTCKLVTTDFPYTISQGGPGQTWLAVSHHKEVWQHHRQQHLRGLL